MNVLFQLCAFTICALFVGINAFPEKEKVDENGVIWYGPIRKCDKGSNADLAECTRKIVEDLTPLVGAGIEELGLRPLDPLRVQKFAYEKFLGPVNISLVAKNIKVTNLAKYKILKFGVEAEKMKMSFIYEAPNVHVEANYKLGGKVFFFPLTGSGPVTIDVYNVKAEGELIGKVVKNANGEDVALVDQVKFNKMSITDMKLLIRGLFDGNPLLSTVVHYVGQRFGKEVFEVIRPEISEFAGNIISHELLNPILSRLPYITEYIPK